MNNERRIDFVIAGAQKCGTTTLDAMLREHPEVAMCRVKESHYFDYPHRNNYADYHKLFPPAGEFTVMGETTPSYLYVRDAMRNLWEYNKNLKIIVVLRNPATRAYSHWNMLRSRNEIDLSFGEAIRREPELIGASGDRETKKFAFLDRGRYTGQLKRMWSFFPPAQCLVLKYETLFSNIEESAARIMDFLNISVVPLPSVRKRTGIYDRQISSEDLEYIHRKFEREFSDLRSMVSFDISDWRELHVA